MFHFITETMEQYYQNKLLSIAHSRVDRYISLHYQGLNGALYSKDAIKKIGECHFTVPSKRERGVIYTVDMEAGICSCIQGIDGSPCSHQAAVAIHYGCSSINSIPTTDPQAKRNLAYIAFGDNAVKDLSFYGLL